MGKPKSKLMSDRKYRSGMLKARKRWGTYIDGIVSDIVTGLKPPYTKAHIHSITQQTLKAHNYTKRSYAYLQGTLGAVQPDLDERDINKKIKKLPHGVPVKLTATYQAKEITKQVLRRIRSGAQKDLRYSKAVQGLRVATVADTIKNLGEINKSLPLKGLIAKEVYTQKDVETIKRLVEDARKVIAADIKRKSKDQIKKTGASRTDRIVAYETRSMYQGAKLKALQSQGVHYVLWELSPKHKIKDVCDSLANKVYPINSVPYGGCPHSFCMCSLTPCDRNGKKISY